MAKSCPLGSPRSLAVFGLGCIASAAALGQPVNMTPGEVALTHPVCEDAQGMPAGWTQYYRHSPRAPYWESVMGKTFWGVHHYCWGLIHLQRAARPGLSKQERDHMIRSAIGDFYYVINDARRNGEHNMVLLPELFYRCGESYVLLGEYPKALEEYTRSRKAKPDYWPAYVGQANLYLRLGMRAQAREVLEAGLEVMPGEPNLLEVMRKAGGSTEPRRPGTGSAQPPAAQATSPQPAASAEATGAAGSAAPASAPSR